ncbi:inositol 1,4,5-triphosphate receptor associated 2 [Macaca nemestrina]|uniref:inositol 1,4,5-triphosphate receptor associated 2 n=1 Tax=Macaca nemestrina TaxID=9545 RepID=UPI0039B8387A
MVNIHLLMKSNHYSTESIRIYKLFLLIGWKQEADDGKEDVTYSINRACEEEALTNIFNACDIKQKGSVGVAKIIDFLRQTTSQNSEDSGLEQLWNMLDPEKRDPHVDLETFQAMMKESMAYCGNKWEGVNHRLSSIIDDSVFEQDGIKSDGTMKMSTDTTDSMSGSFVALGGDTSKGVLEVSDLIAYVADLHFNKQKLEEENNKFKLALENLEETNSQLSEDCTELRLQVKSAHQAIMRTNLLKEELEELKLSMNASEEQKSMIVAQSKQLVLETENRALILKIRILQEEHVLLKGCWSGWEELKLNKEGSEFMGRLKDNEKVVGSMDCKFQGGSKVCGYRGSNLERQEVVVEERDACN